MTQDERLMPARAGRELDRPLADLTQGKGYGRYGGAAAETSLRDYLFVILKRKWLILGVVLVITSLAAIQQYRQPSIYLGSAQLKIEEKPPNILSSSQIVFSQRDPNFWGTQLKLLQNPLLAQQVILTLDLQHNPHFLGGQVDGGLFSSLRQIFSRDRKTAVPAPAMGSGRQPVSVDDLQGKQFTAEELVKLEPYEDAIINNEDVEIVEKTNLVTVKYNHTNPALAQLVANTLVEVFANNNQERLNSGAAATLTKLEQEIANYQTKVKDGRATLVNYAKQYSLPLTGKTTNVENERVVILNKQLLDAENERRDAKAKYDAAKATQESEPFATADSTKSEYLDKLRERLTELESERAALLQIYKEEWPKVKEVEAKIEPIRKELASAQRERLVSLKSQMDAAQARVNSLLKDYSAQVGKTTEQTQHEIELAAMTQQLSADEQYLNTLTQKQRETKATGGAPGTNVSVVTYSRLPHEPTGPRRTRNIFIAMVLSLLVGIGLAFLLDFLDDTVKTLDDVDRYIHLPTLALIPAVRSEKRLREAEPSLIGASTALALVEDARSYVAEAYRHLRTSLLLSSAGKAPKTILVTSSQPSEGKTTTAINTAFMLAQTGAEVLIIDCDLRRPRLHSNFNISNVRGVTNFLSGELPIEEVIQPYEKLPNLKMMPSGPIPPNPAELLGSDQMRQLLTSLGEKFAHIIVDSPPCVSFTDASILSTFVDGVILVIHSGRSSRAVVRRAKQQLADVGAHIFGIVLNNVKLESHGGYYGGYYGRNYYKYGHYYNEYDDDGTKTQSTSA